MANSLTHTNLNRLNVNNNLRKDKKSGYSSTSNGHTESQNDWVLKTRVYGENLLFKGLILCCFTKIDNVVHFCFLRRNVNTGRQIVLYDLLERSDAEVLVCWKKI